MLFNSIDFAIFLPIVFALYWFLSEKKLMYQNLLILSASYLFYGWWDWRFLSLIIFSTVVDYSIGKSISKQENHFNRKLLLWLSISVNLGFLGFFKYCNFFLDNFIAAFSLFGSEIAPNTLNIILPVGISFYTFQTLSYTIDIYKKKINPARDFVGFSAFVSFFPQLVAGPIERASNLLPQFYEKRKFDRNEAVDGLRQILWGLFKKVVIADNCAVFANMIFDNHQDYNGVTLIFGAIFFAFQIYGDFSGYSDIAIGTSRLFGFKLMQNFAFPYFSRDIAEFWRRWHISLSTWFRDYLYIPLGGSRGGLWMKIRNTFIIFLVSGFWHGANWTFIIWGALNAMFFLPLLLSTKNRVNLDIVANDKRLPSFKDVLNILFTFSLITFSWIFFRAASLTEALSYIKRIWMSFSLSAPNVAGKNVDIVILLCLMIFFVLIEWFGRHGKFAIEGVGSIANLYGRWIFYFVIVLLIFVFQGSEQQFIYFQF